MLTHTNLRFHKDYAGQLKKEQQAGQPESTKNFTGERNEVGILWSEPERNLPNNYGKALGQLYSLGRKSQGNVYLKKMYQQSIDINIEKEFMKNLVKSEVRDFSERMIFATRSSCEPKQA